MNEYVVPEDKLEEIAKNFAEIIAHDLGGGPTSPPGKTLRKEIILDKIIIEQEVRKEFEEDA